MRRVFEQILQIAADRLFQLANRSGPASSDRPIRLRAARSADRGSTAKAMIWGQADSCGSLWRNEAPLSLTPAVSANASFRGRPRRLHGRRGRLQIVLDRRRPAGVVHDRRVHRPVGAVVALWSPAPAPHALADHLAGEDVRLRQVHVRRHSPRPVGGSTKGQRPVDRDWAGVEPGPSSPSGRCRPVCNGSRRRALTW